jgi:hypothetical protein
MRQARVVGKIQLRPMRSFKPAVLYFALVLGTGFVFGMIRVPFLVPRLGERYAELLEMPFMLVAIVLAARYVIKHFDLSPRTALRLQAGFAALAMSVLAELLLATVLQGRSLVEFIASRDPVSGVVYLAMLLVFALMPLMLTHPSISQRARHRRA